MAIRCLCQTAGCYIIRSSWNERAPKDLCLYHHIFDLEIDLLSLPNNRHYPQIYETYTIVYSVDRNGIEWTCQIFLRLWEGS